jgi:hypothetical protein
MRHRPLIPKNPQVYPLEASTFPATNPPIHGTVSSRHEWESTNLNEVTVIPSATEGSAVVLQAIPQKVRPPGDFEQFNVKALSLSFPPNPLKTNARKFVRSCRLFRRLA